MAGVISALEENNPTTILGPDNLLRVYNFQKQANSMTNDAETNCRITNFLTKHKDFKLSRLLETMLQFWHTENGTSIMDTECNYNRITF